MRDGGPTHAARKFNRSWVDIAQDGENPALSICEVLPLSQVALLDLRFLVGDMLACLRIEFHDLHFFRRGALVLGGGVEVTGTCGRFQLDFVAARFSHDGPLYVCRSR